MYGHDERIPWMAFFLGVLGAGLGLFLQVYTTLDYPHNAGEAPLGWPAFIPVTFEITILTITVGIFLYLLYLNGLPLAAHPAVLAPATGRPSWTGPPSSSTPPIPGLTRRPPGTSSGP